MNVRSSANILNTLLNNNTARTSSLAERSAGESNQNGASEATGARSAVAGDEGVSLFNEALKPGNQGNHTIVIRLLRQAYQAFLKTENKTYLPFCCYHLALNYKAMGAYRDALIYFLETASRLDLQTDSEAAILKARSVLYIGICYESLGEYCKASNYLSSLKEFSFSGFTESEDFTKGLAHLGHCLIKQNKFSEAIPCLLTAANSTSSTRAVKALACDQLGQAFYKCKDLAKAKDWLKSAQALYLELEENGRNNQKAVADLNQFLGFTYLKLGKFDKGRDCLIKSAKFYKQMRDSAGISTTNLALALCLERLGRHKDALYLFERVQQALESGDDALSLDLISTINDLETALSQELSGFKAVTEKKTEILSLAHQKYDELESSDSDDEMDQTLEKSHLKEEESKFSCSKNDAESSVMQGRKRP